MKPQPLEIRQLIEMFVNKELLLPEMQRRFVWNSTKLRNLIDSIYRDYPSGSILMWRTDQIPETRQSAIEGDATKSPFSEKLLLLDGQQRITSLATVMTGRPIRVRDGDEVVEKHVDVYFNLDHPDKLDLNVDDPTAQIEDARNQFFQIKNKGIENQPNWVSVTKLFQEGVGSILKSLRISYDDPKYDKYNSRLLQLFSRRENYVYPVQILPKEFSYAEATDVFVRVNSLGTRLAGADLALAQVTSRWVGSMALFDAFVVECAKRDFDFDEGFLMRCVMSAATGQSRFDRISKVPIDTIKSSWEQVKSGLEFTINFVRSNAKVETSTIIPSLYAMIPLTIHAVRNDFSFRKDERQLLRWFYAASMWGRYARGSSETILDQDLTALTTATPTETLMRNLLQQVGRVEVSEEDVEGRGTNSPLFMMLYVLAIRNEAKDWGTGIQFSMTPFGKGHKVQHDHIFPRSKLTDMLQRQYEGRMDQVAIRTLVNDLSNIAFLSERENPRKSDRLPAQYLRRIREKLGEHALTAQYVPLDESMWEMERYEDFLKARRKLIVMAINDLMKRIIEPEAAIEPGTVELIHRGESDTTEFKSSLRWDYHKNAPAQEPEYAVAKAACSFMNSKDGSVIIGVDNEGHILGLDKDFSTLRPDKQNTDGFQLHLIQVVRNYLGVEAMDCFRTNFESHEGKIIARLDVKLAPVPIFLKREGRSEFYVRFGNSSQPLNTEEAYKYIQSHFPKTQIWQASTIVSPEVVNHVEDKNYDWDWYEKKIARLPVQVTYAKEIESQIARLISANNWQLSVVHNKNYIAFKLGGRLVFTIDFDDSIGVNLSCWIGKPYDPSSLSMVKWVWDRRFRHGQGIWYTRVTDSNFSFPKIQKVLEDTYQAAVSGAPEQPEIAATPPPEDVEVSYWLSPVKSYEAESAEGEIKDLVGDHKIFAFGERTPGRRDLKPGDWICFYASGNGVVAHAKVLTKPERKPHPEVRHPDEYPYTFGLTEPQLYVNSPVVVDSALRKQLDAFKDRDPNDPWAWFVIGTHRLSKHDFELLTRSSSGA